MVEALANPYREPGDRSCVVDLIEAVLQTAIEQAPPSRPRSSPFSHLLCESHVSVLNSILKPRRLRIVEVWPVASLAIAWRLDTQGPGGETRLIDIHTGALHLGAHNPLSTVLEAVLFEWSDVLSLQPINPGDTSK